MSKPFDDFHDANNPFAAPQTDFGGRAVSRSDVEVIRYQHLGYEHYIQAVGLLSLIGGVACIIGGLFTLFADPNRIANPNVPDAPRFEVILKIIAVAVLIAGAINIYIGLGLREYRRGARILAIVLNWFGLVMNTISLVVMSGGQHVGTAIQLAFIGLILYVLMSAKARTIFSPEYREVVAQTPFIRPRSGCMLIAAGFGLIFLISIGLAAFGLIGPD